jgi:hypothetical protein
MSRPSAVPFVLRRSHAVVRGREVRETREVSHGLLRIEPARVVAQWRTTRVISQAGSEVRTDRELDAVQEVVLPLAGLAGAQVRWTLRRWPPGWQLVLRAADLQTFAAFAGAAALPLAHPAELVLELRAADRSVAREFAADLALALADLALHTAEAPEGLPPAARAGRLGTPRPGGSPATGVGSDLPRS